MPYASDFFDIGKRTGDMQLSCAAGLSRTINSWELPFNGEEKIFVEKTKKSLHGIIGTFFLDIFIKFSLM